MADETIYSEAKMLIRKPAADVFNAMADPQITKNFWFTKGSGKAEINTTVIWEWEMYGVSTNVTFTEIITNQKIAFDWGTPARRVIFTFESVAQDQTYVTATETGYTETGNNLIAVVRDSTGGFTTVLDGMKAFLEHGIMLNLIGDKFPTKK